ncbi:hypothetical protein AVEN_182274-1 [Araneus ventricosus]|uniref:Fibronectin type-III domain-containing protein n=1 Tax=Araneus ventricosus TaxID=182803 RepID=A0A4Y2WD66_ARAVE|nr:hypothetical protein AVEN_224153-1 [Araneus ventricosus]GBO35623.1 hypothetical protein AVEN_182274-1 [Araneus ventricosus]
MNCSSISTRSGKYQEPSRDYFVTSLPVEKNFFSSGNEFVIHGLSFESDYSIRIAARNTVGYSNYSEEVVQRTKGLIAETVVDGSSVSSSFNSAVASALMADIFQHYASILVLYLIIVFKYR